MINRRGLLLGLVAAPAVIRVAPLMRIAPQPIQVIRVVRSSLPPYNLMVREIIHGLEAGRSRLLSEVSGFALPMLVSKNADHWAWPDQVTVMNGDVIEFPYPPPGLRG